MCIVSFSVFVYLYLFGSYEVRPGTSLRSAQAPCLGKSCLFVFLVAHMIIQATPNFFWFFSIFLWFLNWNTQWRKESIGFHQILFQVYLLLSVAITKHCLYVWPVTLPCPLKTPLALYIIDTCGIIVHYWCPWHCILLAPVTLYIIYTMTLYITDIVVCYWRPWHCILYIPWHCTLYIPWHCTIHVIVHYRYCCLLLAPVTLYIIYTMTLYYPCHCTLQILLSVIGACDIVHYWCPWHYTIQVIVL
jgi:hypothetical protein